VVTTVRPRPRSSSRAARAFHGEPSAVNMGNSTPSYPQRLMSASKPPCASVAAAVHSRTFMPILILHLPTVRAILRVGKGTGRKELRKRESRRKREIRQIGKGGSLWASSHLGPFRSFACFRAFAVPGRELSGSEAERSGSRDFHPLARPCRFQDGVADELRLERGAEVGLHFLPYLQAFQEVGQSVDEGVLVADHAAGHPTPV